MRFLTWIAVLLLIGCHGAGNEREAHAGFDGLEGGVLVIEDVTLVDGPRREVVDIVVERGRIVTVGAGPTEPPSGARVLDGVGKWVIPGLVDVHVHDDSSAYLRDMLAWGVTTVQLMPKVPPSGSREVERGSESARTESPRLQLTEMFAGEFPDNLFPGAYQFIKPGTADEARRHVRASHARGYRQIKVIRDDSSLWSGEGSRVPLMPQSVSDALLSEARELGMRVYVHATQREVARTVSFGAMDALLHGVMDTELGTGDMQVLAASGCVWAPTLNALHCFGDQRRYARRVLADERFGALLQGSERAHWAGLAAAEGPIVLPQTAFLVANTEAYLATVGENTRHALRAGVSVAVGTDGGPGGISTHLELEFLQAAGLSPVEILTAATRGGAAALGREAELGAVEAGKLADLVVLKADPTADIRNCREIEWVIKGGVLHRPAQLALED